MNKHVRPKILTGFDYNTMSSASVISLSTQLESLDEPLFFQNKSLLSFACHFIGEKITQISILYFCASFIRYPMVRVGRIMNCNREDHIFPAPLNLIFVLCMHHLQLLGHHLSK